MYVPLADPSSEAVANAVKANLHDFFRHLGRVTQTASGDSALERWHTRVPFPWFNGVLASRATIDGDEDLVREAVAWFEGRSVADFTWWLTPTLARPRWERLLDRCGFEFSEGPPGMAMDLGSLDDAEALPGFRILPVADPETLPAWTRTFIVGYGMPAEWETPALEMMSRVGLGLPIRNYLGYLDGTPVATSSLFLSSGVAGVQFVATLPQARGRGIGRAMTLAALLDARLMGYRIGILQSSEMGLPIYRRLGFRQVCRVEHFTWIGGHGER
jgi:GNAT superfamily N-acetyltransferase